jgi:hypothetical protein
LNAEIGLSDLLLIGLGVGILFCCAALVYFVCCWLGLYRSQGRKQLPQVERDHTGRPLKERV